MPSPLLKVRIDKQGRLVLPQHLRDELVEVPGELLVERTPEGILLRPVGAGAEVLVSDDGLPVLNMDRVVTNAEVLAAIAHERGDR